MLETTADAVVVDVPTHFSVNKYTLIGFAAGASVAVVGVVAVNKFRAKRRRTVTVEVPETPESL